MGSSDNGGERNSKQGNPIFANNIETQPLDDADSQCSGEKFHDESLQFDDTLQLDSEFIFDTEVVREVNEIDTETQLLEDADCIVDEKDVVLESDGEATERTEVLLSDDDDRVSDDVTSFLKMKESNAEIESEDGTTGSEKKKSIYSHDLGTKDILVDSDASTEDESGCAQRSFASIRAASLRSSDIAAALSMSPKRGELSPTKTNGEDGPGLKQGSDKPLHHHTDGIREDNGISSFSDPNFGDHNAENLHKKSQDNVGDETRTRSRRTMARKLFNESTPSRDEELTSRANSPTPERDLPLLDSDHAIAGLSYADSQEPGEQTQANAWNIVDKFLSINDVDLSEQAIPEKTIRGKSPPLSITKGVRSLAEKADFRSPVGQAGIFDWIDGREDDGGGDFFTKRKDALLEGRAKMRKSHTRPLKPRRPTFRQTKGAIDGFEEKSADPQVHHKIMSLTQSDSGLMLNRSMGTGSHISKTLTKKNLLKEMVEKSNMDVSGEKLETSVTDDDQQGICDVGVDTQMAAEALEALVCDVPTNHDVPDAHQLERNVIEGSTGAATKKKACSKHVSVRKKICSSSDSEGKTRQCKRTKKLSAKFSRGSPSSLIQMNNSQAKKRKVNWKRKENLDTRKSFNGNACSEGKPSETVNKWKTGQELGGTLHQSSMSNKHVSFGVLDGTVIPVAQRTRQSVKTNSLKMTDIICKPSHPMEVSTRGSKKRGISDVIDSSEPVTVKGKSLKSCPDPNGKSSNNEMNRQEIQDTGLPNENILKTDYLNKNTLSFPRRRRTHRGKQHDLKNAIEPCIPVESNHKTLSSKTLPKASDFSITNEKMHSKEQKALTSGTITRSGRKYGVDYSLPTVENAEGKGTTEGPVNRMVQTSGTPCTTPSKELNAESPIYAGDDRTEQSSKKSLLRSSLMRELISLGTPGTQTPTWKDMRRRRDMASVRVLFSHHLGEDIIKQQKKIIARLGVLTASSSLDATHFVADKFARTRNMLEAIALGKPVVTHLWLESCGQAGCFIDEKNYILRDTKKEKEIGFNMPISLARACSNPLLKGKIVFITPSVKPDRELIANLVKVAHGQVMERTNKSLLKDGKVPSNLLVISCEEDYAICTPLLEKGAEAYSSELLLNGIVIQKLEYNRHRLFMDHVKRTRSSIWMRSEKGSQFLPVTKQ